MIGTGQIFRPIPRLTEKRAIFVTVVGNSERLTEAGLPSIFSYSKKCGADVIVRRLQQYSDPSRFDFPILEKLAIKDYFCFYDRILYVDSDVLITNHAPNIFEMYVDDSIVAMDEGQFDSVCLPTIPLLKEKLGNVDWKEINGNPIYFNAGVMMFTKKHKMVLEYIAGNLDQWKRTVKYIGWTEQGWLNWIFNKFDIPVQPMDYKYNYILGFNQSNLAKQIAGDKWLELRFNAYFIHYTGGDHFKPVIWTDMNHSKVLKVK